MAGSGLPKRGVNAPEARPSERSKKVRRSVPYQGKALSARFAGRPRRRLISIDETSGRHPFPCRRLAVRTSEVCSDKRFHQRLELSRNVVAVLLMLSFAEQFTAPPALVACRLNRIHPFF